MNHIRRFRYIVFFFNFFVFFLLQKMFLSCLDDRLCQVVVAVPGAEDGQRDQEEPDDEQQEAAEEYEEGGVQLGVSLLLRPLNINM